MRPPRSSLGRRLSRLALAAGLGAGALALVHQHRHPSACPYSQRWMLWFPRPWLSTARLLKVLAPLPGERLLEVGPGVGVQTLAVAEALQPAGRLCVFDVQQEMLDALMQRAGRRGISNIEPRQGDGRRLPYDDGAFDGAYLVTVLGEIPDKEAALRELHRVVRRGGRVVFGEIPLLDPHFVRFSRLEQRARAAGWRFEHRLGPALGFYARFSRE